MANSVQEGSMWRSSIASSASSRILAIKNLVPTPQRDAVRAFFDRRVPPSSTFNPTQQASRNLRVPLENAAEDRKLSWREWAGDKIRRRGSSMSDAVEKVSLFPGWAARRYHNPEMEGQEAAEFSLEIFISGFAASYVPPESATRSQRAFMRLAKAYAALPKIPSPTERPHASFDNEALSRPLSQSTEDLLKTVKLPPRPEDVTEEAEIAALERQFKQAGIDLETESVASTESDSSNSNTPPSSVPRPPSSGVSYATAAGQFTSSVTDPSRLHANLNARLHPFWSRSLPNRSLRLSVYSVPPRSESFLPDDSEERSRFDDDPTRQPIFVHHTSTDPQGAFEARLHIPWQSICVHPGALHVAFGDAEQETELFVCAELLTPPNPNPVIVDLRRTQGVTARSVLPVTISHSQVRLISDIDDTIKFSNILGGARAVFHNVFVKHLEELVIHGMGDWYTQMWSRGVRFHYVSNSPFELLPVINEFIKISNLPRGSIKLRSYAGRSLFNGLLSTPAMRKRAGIVDILNAFNNSRFFLVGDSGEQDLELYAQLAAERHSQILAVFIRDARGPDATPIADPTGEEIKRCPTPSRSASFAAGLDTAPWVSELDSKGRSQTLPPGLDMTTPTPKSVAKMNGPFSDPGPGTQDYLASSALSLKAPFAQRRQPGAVSRPSSAPSSSLGLPSTFFDSSFGSGTGMSTTSSPASSRPPSPSPTSSTATLASFHFPGSLTESEVSSLPVAEKKRYKLQERVYRARLLMPSHIPLRVFMNPEECVEADRILDDIAQVRSCLNSNSTSESTSISAMNVRNERKR